MPRTTLKTQEQYEWAVNRVEELLPLVDDTTPENAPERIELELLSNLVADYSDVHFALNRPTLPEALKQRMEEMGLDLFQTAMLLGHRPSTLHNLLEGRTFPTYTLARKLCLKMGMDANIVLGV